MTRPLFPPVFAPIVSRPMLDDFAIRAARMRERNAPAGIPSVQTLLLRDHPMWIGNNELGNEAPFAADADNRQMLLKLSTWGAPRVWSVMLGLVFNENDLVGTNGFSVIAQVIAGAGGAVQEFEVDWIEGMTFSCVANAIIVNAVYDNATDVPPSLLLRATAGEKPLNALPAVRSFRVALAPSVAPGNTTTVRVPRFSRNLVIEPAGGTVGALGGTTIYGLQAVSGGTSTQLTGAQIAALGTGNRISIPNGIRYIFITNADPAFAVNINLKFELGL